MRQIGIFFGSALLAALLFPFLWFMSLGRYVPAEHWIRDVYVVKDHRAATIAGSKIIILSGSNALFGIDSGLLERLTGIPVVNLASHASLPLRFHIEKALAVVRSGDTVVMPLEFGYLISSPEPTDWEIANLSSWGHRYVERSLASLIHYFRYSNPRDVVRRFVSGSISGPSDDLILSTAASNGAGPEEWRGYNFRSVNLHGDFYVKNGGDPFSGDSGYTTGLTTKYAVNLLQGFRDDLERRGARLLITWPVSIKNRLFDLDAAGPRSAVDEIRKTLVGAGLDVRCDASDFQFPRSLFLNTTYHLGALGADMRTEVLSKCIQGIKPDREAIGKRWMEKPGPLTSNAQRD